MGAAESLEQLEAEVRRLMAKHAAINARGWSTTRERSVIHKRIDSLLDDHAELAQTVALDAVWDQPATKKRKVAR